MGVNVLSISLSAILAFGSVASPPMPMPAETVSPRASSAIAPQTSDFFALENLKEATQECEKRFPRSPHRSTAEFYICRGAMMLASLKEAAKSDPEAMARLGWWYLEGLDRRELQFDSFGIRPKADNTVARNLFEKAAALGHAGAMAHLGWMYLEGHGVPQDYAAAAQWFQKGAQAGAPRAMATLGVLLLDGRGVQPDRAAGTDWLRKAAMAGDKRGMAFLALALISGDRTKVPPESVEWLKKACPAVGWRYFEVRAPESTSRQRNDALACYFLGRLVEEAHAIAVPASAVNPGTITGTPAKARSVMALRAYEAVADSFSQNHMFSGWYELGNGRPQTIQQQALQRSEQLNNQVFGSGDLSGAELAGVALLGLLVVGLLAGDGGPSSDSPQLHDDSAWLYTWGGMGFVGLLHAK